MIGLSVLWLAIGLMVIYRIGISEILSSYDMAISIREDNKGNSIDFAFSAFLMVLVWPLVWIDYNRTDHH